MTRKRRSYQQGSIRAIKTKNRTVFQIRYRKRKADGGWAQVSENLRDCPSKRAAQKILDERLRKINESNGGMTRSLKTMADLFRSAWPNYLTKQRVKGSSISSWDTIVNKWISPYFGNRILSEIEPTDIGDFISYLHSKGLSQKYQVNIYGVLRLMFDVAQLNGFIASNPVNPKIHRPLVDRKRKSVWTVGQARALLLAVRPEYRTPLVVLALTGIRAGELLALRWINIDFLRKRIVITGSIWRGKLVSTKTEASDREIGMSDHLARILLEHRKATSFKDPGDFVFSKADGAPIDPDSLRRQGIYPALKAVGIPYVKRASGCHAFRHLAGSIIHKETGSLKMAQEQLGHADVGTTGNIYVHTDDELVNRSAEILGNVLGDSCGLTVVETVSEKGSVQ